MGERRSASRRTLLTLLPTDLARTRGGGERCAEQIHAQLCSLLAGWRHVALAATSDATARDVPSGWRNAIGGRAQQPPPVADALSTRAVLDALRAADLVIAHQWRTRATAISRLVRGVRPSMRLVVFDHGGASVPGARWAGRPLPRPDLAAVQSEFERRVTPMRGRQLGNVRGGVAQELFHPHGRAGRPHDFLMVARFEPHKGQTLFLEALPANARALLVGPSATKDGSYRDAVLERARNRGVEVLLDATDEQVAGAYNAARYTVQVSVPNAGASAPPELLGLSLLEAMACGSVPICGRDGPGVEFVTDGLSGYTYEAAQLEDLRRVMSRAHASPEPVRAGLAAAAVGESERWTWRAAATTVIDSLGIAAERAAGE